MRRMGHPSHSPARHGTRPLPRIRSIKPEFPQSESMGRVSREARYCFILLWTIADDEGRLRASSRMLASLLYPYDTDAVDNIDGWLEALEREGCVRRYTIGGTTYLEITNWLKHQKIDRPSKSRLPEFVGCSRAFVAGSTTDLGPRTLDQDLGSKDLGSHKEREAALGVTVDLVLPNSAHHQALKKKRAVG